MALPTYGSLKRPSKFGVKTTTFNIRLPLDTIKKIKEKGIDTGQIVYDVVEGGLNPYTKPNPDLENDVGLSLVNKLVGLMIEHEISTPEGFFTHQEQEAIKVVAKEIG